MRVVLAQSRGFCAGVRAIEFVERSFQLSGAPVYVRHEIVHNKAMVDSLKAKSAVFVEELNEVSVLSSAHDVGQTGVIAGFGLFGKVCSVQACELRRHSACLPGDGVQGVICLRY
jgi:4-hydroxy-3-methylbut-2-enyl diphosphate reductase IspH